MAARESSAKLIAFADAEDDPACRFRIQQYIPDLSKAGWEVSLRTNHPPCPWASPYQLPALRSAHQRAGLIQRRLQRRWDIHQASDYDVVLLNRDLLEGRVEYEKVLLHRNPRVVFDFDDAIFLGKNASHIRWICERAAWVTAGSDYLASFARRYTDRISILPTVVNPGVYRIHKQENPTGAVRFGWLGSDRSIRETLFPHVAMLAELQSELQFEFVVVSRPKPNLPESALRWQFHEWSPQTEARIGELFDIGVMPLVDDEYQRGKCGCKLLEYMAAALPCIASPVGINPALIGESRSGFLANSPREWREAVSVLMADATLRQKLGMEGRSFVEREFSIQRWFPSLLGVLERVRALPRRQ
jgi:glycosyltransferase involved in cell wall biosynthesis